MHNRGCAACKGSRGRILPSSSRWALAFLALQLRHARSCPSSWGRLVRASRQGCVLGFGAHLDTLGRFQREILKLVSSFRIHFPNKPQFSGSGS